MRLSITNTVALVLCLCSQGLAEPSRTTVDLKQTFVESAEDQVRQGNLGVIEGLNGRESLLELYKLLALAIHQQFGGSSGQVERAVAQKIASIPGHARYLGDQIEE